MLQGQLKNLKIYLDNIPYPQKALMYDHIALFIKDNNTFSIRTGVKKTYDESYYSYIQIVGYVKIGNVMVELIIIMPHNYPSALPIFNLRFNRQSFKIISESILVKDKFIHIQKQESGQEFIRLTFPKVEKFWASNKNINANFKELMKIINNPPLVQEVYEVSIPKKQPQFKKNISTQQLNEFEGNLLTELAEITNQEEQTINDSKNIYYLNSRTDFMMRNIPKISKEMQKHVSIINQQTKHVERIQESVKMHQNLDLLIDFKNKDQKQKIELLSEKHALKEIQSKLQQTINEGNYHGYKGQLKKLYERMFMNRIMRDRFLERIE